MFNNVLIPVFLLLSCQLQCQTTLLLLLPPPPSLLLLPLLLLLLLQASPLWC
jgi:hypothetical protein